MTSLFITIFSQIGLKLLSEKMFGKVLVYSLKKISISTDNTLDDKLVDSVADALNVTDYKEVK